MKNGNKKFDYNLLGVVGIVAIVALAFGFLSNSGHGYGMKSAECGNYEEVSEERGNLVGQAFAVTKGGRTTADEDKTDIYRQFRLEGNETYSIVSDFNCFGDNGRIGINFFDGPGSSLDVYIDGRIGNTPINGQRYNLEEGESIELDVNNDGDADIRITYRFQRRGVYHVRVEILCDNEDEENLKELGHKEKFTEKYFKGDSSTTK